MYGRGGPLGAAPVEQPLADPDRGDEVAGECRGGPDHQEDRQAEGRADDRDHGEDSHERDDDEARPGRTRVSRRVRG